MPKFTLERLEAVNGKLVIEKLVIDGICQFDEYSNEINKNGQYLIELGKIYNYIEQQANFNLLPSEKFKDITPEKETVKEYEFKTKHLRVYAIKRNNGKVIILGGYKNSQKRDINKFKSIKKLFLENYEKR